MNKRFWSILLSLALLLTMLPVIPFSAQATQEEVTISLWTYPIGAWGNEDTVKEVINGFQNVYPHITVNVTCLNYSNGDQKLEEAVTNGQAPDLVLEAPERLVSVWGENGYLEDLSDLVDAQDAEELYTPALSAGRGSDGKLYMYPLCGTVHSMAINKTVFEAAGAMQYLNEQTHRWNSTEDFFKAVQAVYEYTGKRVGTVYCGGQGGDQGTRALVNNLYGGTYTDAAHTRYTWATQENIAALQALYNCAGLEFDTGIVGGDDISAFLSGNQSMTICWNINQNSFHEATDNGDEILPMAFPANGDPALANGVWGFSLFDNQDAARSEASRLFIRYMCDSAATADAVDISGFLPVRSAVDGAYIGESFEQISYKEPFVTMMPLMGDYYVVTPNWAEARTAWWNMLIEISQGADIASTVETYNTWANNHLENEEETETTKPIIADEITTVRITSGGEYAYFSFTPAYTESYTFYSTGGDDTYGYLYDGDLNQITYDDDGGDGGNFSITYTLEAGVTYIWGARFYSDSYTGNIAVMLRTNHVGEGVVTTPATCTEDGLMTYTCSVCGVEYTEVIPGGHSYDEGVVTTPATCTEDGVMTYTCTVCGNTYTEAIPGSHSYDEGVVTIPATCTEDGVMTYTCAVCGDAYTGVIPGRHNYNESGICTQCGQDKYPISGTCGDNLIWMLERNGKLTISGEGAMDDFGYYLPWNDYDEDIDSVEIGNGVTSICQNAFSMCYNLKKVVIPESVTQIGYYAFDRCESLSEIVIPKGVTSIETGTFAYCSGLTNVVFLGDQVSSIGASAFSGCDSLTKFVVPEGVVSIGEGAFSHCAELAYIEIPTTVTSIGDSAFYDGSEGTHEADCPVSIHFYGDAPAIGADVFGNAVVAAYYPESNTTWTGDVMQDYGGTVTWLPEVSSDEIIASGISGDGLSWEFAGDGTLTISGTGDMWGYFWDDMPWSVYRGGIFNLVIEEGVSSIGGDAFIHCVNLSSVSLPEGITSIGNRSFMFCRSLQTVNIPKCVTDIDSAAFDFCSSIEKFVADAENVYYCSDDAGVLFNKDMTEIVAVPKAISGHYVLPESVTNIPYGAFEYCDDLSEITIPSSVNSIESYAFGWCDGLEKVHFKGNAPTFESDVFNWDTITAYYPANNETWTVDVMQDMGGTITWVPYYEVIEEGTDIEVAPGEEAVIHIEADHTTLVAVYMDGELVDPSNYTVTEGSTIITFNAEYLTRLEGGEHQITAAFDGGAVAFATITTSGPTYTPGDINDDGKVNNKDLTRLFQYLSNWEVEVVEEALDINGDGKVNNKDLTRLFQYLSNWDVEIF